MAKETFVSRLDVVRQGVLVLKLKGYHLGIQLSVKCRRAYGVTTVGEAIAAE